MDQFREKPKDLIVVQAEKFFRGDHPLGRDPEFFHDLRIAVDTKGAYVMMGDQVARNGDYFVIFSGGNSRLMTAKDFEDQFEQFGTCPEPTAATPKEPDGSHDSTPIDSDGGTSTNPV